MSHHLPAARTLLRRSAILALSASALFAASGLQAAAQSGRARHQTDQEREYRAAYAYRGAERCVAANGAQIMAGFAGPGDKLDTVTGELCSQ